VRVVVIGGTGNVGLALVRALSRSDQVTEVIAVARRRPQLPLARVRWLSADVAVDPVEPLVTGADAVVHLAWLIQPSRSLERQRHVNVDGTAHVLAAVAAAQVPALVVASSVGAYSPGPGRRPVDESWPTHGIATSAYSRQKAYVERMLDDFAGRHPGTRLVRLRPGLIFQPEAAASQRRYFAGPFVPRALLRRGVLPVLPHLPDVRFQAVHAADVADAYVAAVLRDVHGAFNVAADPVLTTRDAADLLGARPVTVPFALARWGLDVSWRLRLHPLSPGWLDLAARSPLLDTTRARRELGWRPQHDGREALDIVLRGIASGAAGPTPPLRPMGPLRQLREALRTGMGRRSASDGRTTEPDRA
jgi:nucleoside-diphosphate-sugar epimerase